MGYWLHVWNTPRLLLTPLDELAMAAECLLVLLVVAALYALVSGAMKMRRG